MGNESSTSPKRLFEQLDRTKDGVLTLDDLLTLGKIDVQRPFTQSPLLLFRFDDGADGALSKEEFVKYLRHLQKYEKQRDEDKRKKQKEEKKHKEKRKEEKRSKKDGEAESASSSQPWLIIDKKTADKMKLSRNTETPCLLGTGSPGSSSLLDIQDQDEESHFSEETKGFLNHLLSRSEWRKQYMAWLFRLADVDKDGDLDVKELELILKALENDGIQTKDLSFHQSEGSTVAQSLLEEYNTGKTGVLTREEFMLLADLILRHYEAQTTSKPGLHKIGRYEIKRKLGTGSNSIVRLGIDRETGERKAIKIIKRGDVSDMSRVDVELKAMMMLDHPSIVKLDEVLENEDYIFFVMELCGGGSLSNYLERKPLSEPLARYYMLQLLSGLAYCHSKGVCHRDLKLENLVIDNNGHLNITDFGHAGIYRKGWDLFSTGLVGSLYHISPEQIAGQCYSGEKIDVWGVGIILYRLLTGKPPFYSPNTQEMFDAIQTVKYELPEHLSNEARDLIQQILRTNPEERPSCKALLKHSWFKGPVKQPAMACFVLKLDPKLDPESVWKEICNSLTALNIHVLKDITSKYNCIHMVKCVDPKRDIKFSVSLKTKKEPGQPPFIEFNLKEGEAWDFNQTVYKIRSAHRRWRQQQLSETQDKGDLSSLESTEAPSHSSLDESKRGTASPTSPRRKGATLNDRGVEERQGRADFTPIKERKNSGKRQDLEGIGGEEERKPSGAYKVGNEDTKPKGRERLKSASDGIRAFSPSHQHNRLGKTKPFGDGDDSSTLSSSDSESGEATEKRKEGTAKKNEHDGDSDETGEQEEPSYKTPMHSDSENEVENTRRRHAGAFSPRRVHLRRRWFLDSSSSSSDDDSDDSDHEASSRRGPPVSPRFRGLDYDLRKKKEEKRKKDEDKDDRKRDKELKKRKEKELEKEREKREKEDREDKRREEAKRREELKRQEEDKRREKEEKRKEEERKKEKSKDEKKKRQEKMKNEEMKGRRLRDEEMRKKLKSTESDKRRQRRKNTANSSESDESSSTDTDSSEEETTRRKRGKPNHSSPSSDDSDDEAPYKRNTKSRRQKSLGAEEEKKELERKRSGERLSGKKVANPEKKEGVPEENGERSSVARKSSQDSYGDNPESNRKRMNDDEPRKFGKEKKKSKNSDNEDSGPEGNERKRKIAESSDEEDKRDEKEYKRTRTLSKEPSTPGKDRLELLKRKSKKLISSVDTDILFASKANREERAKYHSDDEVEMATRWELDDKEEGAKERKGREEGRKEKKDREQRLEKEKKEKRDDRRDSDKKDDRREKKDKEAEKRDRDRREKERQNKEEKDKLREKEKQREKERERQRDKDKEREEREKAKAREQREEKDTEKDRRERKRLQEKSDNKEKNKEKEDDAENRDTRPNVKSEAEESHVSAIGYTEGEEFADDEGDTDAETDVTQSVFSDEEGAERNRTHKEPSNRVSNKAVVPESDLEEGNEEASEDLGVDEENADPSMRPANRA